jgi:hypothetical protein
LGNYNPYAYTSPEQPSPQAAPPLRGEPQPWQVGEVIAHAWSMFKPVWPTLVFAHFLGGLLARVPNFVPTIFVAAQAVEPDSRAYWLINSACLLLGLIISVFFGAPASSRSVVPQPAARPLSSATCSLEADTSSRCSSWS